MLVRARPVQRQYDVFILDRFHRPSPVPAGAVRFALARSPKTGQTIATSFSVGDRLRSADLSV